MTDRCFTLEEAQALVPWLQETFGAIARLKAELARATERVQTLSIHMQSNGGSGAEAELEEATQALHEAEDGIDEHAYAIVERGIILRSLDRGLVDFPSMRYGREAHLCWLAGEADITHWHEVDARFRWAAAAATRNGQARDWSRRRASAGA